MNSMGEHSPFLFREINSLSPSEPSNQDQSVIFHSQFCSALLFSAVISTLFLLWSYCAVLFSALLFLFSALCTLLAKKVHFSRKGNGDFSPRNPERWKNTPDSTNY